MNQILNKMDNNVEHENHNFITIPELTRLLRETANKSSHEASDFFNRFGFVDEYWKKDYDQAFINGIELLNTCKRLDPKAFNQIHKGSPYYWIAISACMIHNYDKAIYFFSSAAEEDLRSLKKEHHLDRLNDNATLTPALLFMIADSENTNQAARELTKKLTDILNHFIDEYNKICKYSKYTLVNLQEHFLKRALSPKNKNLRSCITALLSFCLEWEYIQKLLIIKPTNYSNEVFFLHLLKGCVVFETILRENPKNLSVKSLRTLNKVLNTIFIDLGLEKIPDINSEDLKLTLIFLNSYDSSIHQAIEITGKLRNNIGHSLGWKCKISTRQYTKACKNIMISCLHAISTLY